MLRIDPELYAVLKRWADGDLRSVNAQIEYLLRQAVKSSRRGDVEEDPEAEGDGS